MHRLCTSVLVLFVLSLLLAPSSAGAAARLVSVVAVDGGCVAGPTGPAVSSWDVEPGSTYLLTLEDVFECADGGNAATLDVRVNSSNTGNVDLVATQVSPGVYEFEFTLPVDAVCTMPIWYCTTPGDASSGLMVVRADGVAFQSHLRASTFEAGCTNPMEIIGGDCAPIPGVERSWGTLKSKFD